jgi:hypothetical protein
MKTTENTFRDHLNGDVTALCTCWQITPRRGDALYFTDSDQDVVRDGITYKSVGAYSRSAIENTSYLSVDNLEVTGMATELSLPVEELRAGKFDHAEILVFMTSWLTPVGGKLKLRRGFFGEVTVLPNDTFTVELRGVLQRLSNSFADVYSATCRHDLGDDGCTIDLSHPFTLEGAHIPIKLLDPNFEEAGMAGMSSSYSWYNPINDEELIDATATYSGVYAGHGSELGGWLQQDIDLYEMSDDFRAHVDAEEVDINLFGWRRDDGDMGRISLTFLDDGMKEVRRGSGAANVSTVIPEVRVTGDYTIETMFRVPYDTGTDNWRTSLWGYRVSNAVQDLFIDWENSVISYDLDHGFNIFTEFSIPFTAVAEEWHHVALVKEGQTFRLYLNGVLMHEEVTTYTGDLIIDTLGTGRWPGWTGLLDEFRVWNVVRSQTDISLNRFNDLPSGDPTLERYYPFDGDSLDYGTNVTGGIAAALGGVHSPVKHHLRGQVTSFTTGYEDVGTSWALKDIRNVPVPRHTRYVRYRFDHQSVAGTPTGTRLDGVYGWFRDEANVEPMPNFNVGDDPSVWTRAGMVNTSTGNRVFTATIDDPRSTHRGWFQGGLVTFYAGRNAGASMEVKSWDPATNAIELFLSMPYPINQGDLFTVYPGCDKTRVGCRALFNNVINFFGTPDVPGEDELYRYQDSPP